MPRITYDDPDAEDQFKMNTPRLSMESYGDGGNPSTKVDLSASNSDSTVGVSARLKSDRGRNDSYGVMFNYTKRF